MEEGSGVMPNLGGAGQITESKYTSVSAGGVGWSRWFADIRTGLEVGSWRQGARLCAPTGDATGAYGRMPTHFGDTGDSWG